MEIATGRMRLSHLRLPRERPIAAVELLTSSFRIWTPRRLVGPRAVAQPQAKLKHA